MKRTATTIGLLGCAVIAMAYSSFGSIFDKTYNISKTSNLGKASCATCHLSKKGGKLNPYGKDIAKVMKEQNTKKLTAAILHAVDKLDSTKTGKTNLAKINADKNPGVD